MGLELDKIHIAGTSNGAYLAQYYGICRPERINKITCYYLAITCLMDCGSGGKMCGEVVANMDSADSVNKIDSIDSVNYWDLGDIRLRAAEKTDAGMFTEHYLSSPAGIERAFDRIRLPQVYENAERWLAGYNVAGGGGSRDDRCVFIIEETLGGDFLGYIDVWEADSRNGVFKTGIKMLEGKAGKGYATRAFVRVLGYYFNELRYQKCAIYIYEFNEASQHFHEKLGFTAEGRLRREYFSNGRYYDSICYGLMVEEFLKHPYF